MALSAMPRQCTVQSLQHGKSGLLRGPADQPSNVNGAGVYIGGFPINNRSTPTAYAQNIAVVGNTLYQCARAGVYITGAKAINVDANLILNCGTQFLADGATAISTSDNTQNVGIYLDNNGTNTDITVRSNTVLDERATPYCNQALVPSNPGGNSFITVITWLGAAIRTI